MTDLTRRELRLYASVIIACVFSLFALLAWQTMQVNKQLRARYETEKTLVHITTGCAQRPDGSAECAPKTFLPQPVVTVGER